MLANALNLPLDIPWKRICVSQDMIDRSHCDRKFPYRWRSSVAVFSYEPPKEYQTNEGQIVTYLKVVCTVTGFQPDPHEVGIANRRIDSYWNSPAVIENYKEIASKYYGCYGAILEVSISPKGTKEEIARIPSSKFPYFSDYEPKKREMYEVVTDTGETMSRSLEGVNVRKGVTTSESHEVVGIFGGFNASAQVGPYGGSLGVNGQWGTRDINHQEYADLRTTDSAREARETYSHTTQLTQMYHQLNSYHLGTNRAVFFMLPRPHIVQSDTTFVNGPRLLEGVQEFFLVTVRPDDIEDICVEAYLETAHIVSEPQFTYDTSTATVRVHVEKQCNDTSGSLGDDSNTSYNQNSETYNPPDGWEIDVSRNGGFSIDSHDGDRVEGYGVSSIAADHITVWGKVSAYYNDRTWPVANVCEPGRLDLVVTVFLRKKTPTVTGYQQNLWLTGRGVCCCSGENDRIFLNPGLSHYVTFEKALQHAGLHEVGANARMAVQEANALQSQIGRELVNSIHHPDRYPFESVQFVDTKFVGRTVSKLLRSDGHPDNQPVTGIIGLDRRIAEKISAVAPRLSRGRLLVMSLEEKMDRFGLTAEEAREAGRAALGLNGPDLSPKDRWNAPENRSHGNGQTLPVVPAVVGLALEESAEVLKRNGYAVLTVKQNDYASPEGTVIDQTPAAGSEAEHGTEVTLVVSAGEALKLPDIVGKSLTHALLALRDAGFESEPSIVFHPNSDLPGSVVLKTVPEAGAPTFADASIVLEVSGGKERNEGTKGTRQTRK